MSLFEIVKIQMHFRSNYLIFLFYIFDKCVDLGKIFKNEIYLFSLGQIMKNIIMFKVGYFCMGRRIM
jgi:hypothetical protein